MEKTYKKIGIYIIHCHLSMKVYVGSSINITNRQWDHKTRLKAKKHPNNHLQSAYNLYGGTAFSYSILEECTKEQLVERESYWIRFYDSVNPDKGYNVTIPDLNYDFSKFKNTKAKRDSSSYNNLTKEVMVINTKTKEVKEYKSMISACTDTTCPYNKLNNIIYYWHIFTTKEEYKRKSKLRSFKDYTFVRKSDYNPSIDYTIEQLFRRQKPKKEVIKVEPKPYKDRTLKRIKVVVTNTHTGEDTICESIASATSTFKFTKDKVYKCLKDKSTYKGFKISYF